MARSIVIPDAVIVNKIYMVRGEKIMLDADLAELYGVETKRLKEQVNRNLPRFPVHFMFELTAKEYDSIRSQNATLKQGGHSKYMPYAFTEHGVLMLSNVLKSARAIDMSIKIIDVFVKLREMLVTHKDILQKIEQMEKKMAGHDEEIQMIFAALKELIEPAAKRRKKIGFKIKK